MGVSAYYQAIPEESRLFHRVQTEKPFSTLFNSLFPCGSGIFDFLSWNEAEIEQEIDEIVENEEIPGSRAEIEGWIKELRAELEYSETKYPGIGRRVVYLEKCHYLIDELLVQQLKKRQLDRLIPLTEKLWYGDRDFASDLLGDRELEIVPSSIVREGAQMLRELESEALFISEYEYWLEEFQSWRDLYLEAAEKGEAVLIKFR